MFLQTTKWFPPISKVFREIGYADELGSGMRNTNKYTKLYSGGTPSFIEDDVFRISIPIDNVANLKVGGNENLIQKNERSLSEVLSEVLSVKDFEKVRPIVMILEEKGFITPKEAKEVCGKSTATVRRYLNLLVKAEVVTLEGSTNKVVYKIIEK